MAPASQTPRSHSSPAEDQLLCIRVWAGCCTCFPCDEKSLKLHRRSLEMKFYFSMTHTYTPRPGFCRASVNPAPCSLPNPSICPLRCCRCLLLMLLTGGYHLQRVRVRPSRHVSVIEGRNLARLDRSSAWVHLARPVHMAHGVTAYFFSLLLCLSAEMSGLPPAPLPHGPGHVRARAEPLPPPHSPCPACLLCTCIITGSPTAPGLGRVLSCLSGRLPGQTPVPVGPICPDRAQLLICFARDAVCIS